MNFSVFTKPLCRFLIHRYMGQYLKTELTSDQLEFRLADGTATVQGVMLNSDFINETLESSGIKIISFVDGYVEELTVCVPWKRLLNDSTIIKVSGLQITLTPLADINTTNTQELVSSFIGSIASSMDLAKSVIVDEQLANESDSGGIEQFATLIDQIISRIKVIFENITIRIESYSEASGLCTGIEIQIDKMEFLDENLEEQMKNAHGAITEQPARLYTTTDLNKLLHIQGVRLYTDIWTPLKNNKLINSQINSSDSEGDTEMTALNFQSCYSHFSSRSNSNTATRPQNLIPPNPILFAQFFSEKHTLRIRVNNSNAAMNQTDNSSFNKRIDIDIFLGGPLYIFLTPSQIMLLQNILSLLLPKEKEHQPINNANANNFGGLPMNKEHFNRMMEQIQEEFFETEHKQKFVAQKGTWSGTEQYHEFADNQNDYKWRKIIGGQKFRPNSPEMEMEEKNHSKTGSTTTLVERRPNIFTISLRAPTLIVVFTHDDPLSKDSMEQYGEMISQTFPNVVNTMVEKAEHFFKTAAELRLNKKKIAEQGALLSNIYKGDCLRLLANGFFASYFLTSECQRNLMEIEGHLDECDFKECLWSEEGSQLQSIDIMCLSNANNNVGVGPLMTFKLKNTLERENDYFLNIDIENCKAELDPSIVDRIANLLFIQPYFLCKNSIVKPKFEAGTAPLDDKLLQEPLESSESLMSFSVKCYCASLKLKLRIPIADLSKIELPKKRELHQECLLLEFEGAEIVLPKSFLADIPVHWTMNLQCKSAKGTFSGDPNFMECTNEAMTFFCADATNAERTMGNVNGIKLTISFDKRNKSLSKILLAPENLTRSITESIFNANDREKIEGPFSTKDTFHFKDGTNRSSEDGEPSQKLIKAGSRKELMEFADECRTLSNLLIDISIGQLNLSLPSRKFLEILYNRFANDLALWEPRASKSKKKNSEQNVKEFLECQSAFIHENEEENCDERDADELSEITNFSKRTTATTLKRGNYRSQKIESHQFSFGIHIERARILIQRTNNVDAEEFQSQVGMELLNADSFLVYGFKGDPNLTYFFTTSTNAELYHKNLFTQNAFSGNVADFQTFMLPKPKENIYLNEVPKDHNFERINDDNFVLSLKMYFHENMNTKDILLAFGLRNSLLHVRPFERIEHFWPKQFADFLNIADYGVPGYVPPTINADLRIHFSTVYLGYDHSSIIQNSPFQLRLEIGSSYISTYLVENIERLKFDCIFEDTNLWMRKKIQESVKFESQTRFYNPANNFVKILMADSIHFILAYTLLLNGNSPGPAIDFACADQNLTLWLCSDTIVEFLNIFKELFCSDIVKKFLTSLKSNEFELQEKNEQNDVKGKFERQESVPNDKCAIKRNVSMNDEERLVRDMEAAIHDIPTVFHTNMAKHHMEMMMDDEEDEYSAQAMAEMDNTDDEFIVIDKVPARVAHKPGIGVTQIGSRFQTHFDSGGDFEFVTTQINIAAVVDDPSDEQPPDQSSVLISYKMRFSSLTIFLFGGSDFADSARALPQKIYSQWEMNRDISLFDEVNSQGGRYRDHTVLVEIKFTRLSTICKLFNESSPNLSSVLLELGDFSIIDHLSISQINEMVHRLEIEGQPKSSAPFLKVFLKEDQLREAIMRITLAPIRLNFDQDTFDFLIDFKNDLAQGLRNVFDIPAIAANKNDDDVPVMEVPKTTEANAEYIESRPISHASTDNSNESSLHQSFSKGISFNDLKQKDERTAANIEELFSEDDVVLGDSVYDEKCSAASSRRGSDLIRQTESPSTTISENIKKEQEMETINKSKSLAAKSTFIKDFTFSPACRLRIDYEAKNRIRTEHQGPFLAFLLGMTNLKKTELVLKEIRVEKGFLGFGRCAQFVVDEWQNDIINKQLRNVVGGVAVINAVVQLAQGFKDLVVYPLEEYKKENGQLARGLQRGTSSFGLNAATAAIDATQRIVGLVQNIAELTYDILNPNFVYQQGTQPMHIPGDLREGFSLACETVRVGIVDTTQSLQSAAERDRARGGWGVGILRHITPTAIKPIVVASKATSHVLGGLKNQLKPEEHKEEMRKWRHNAINGKRSFEQLRRQQSSSSTSSSTQQTSSSSGSFTRTYDIPPRKNW